MTTVSTRRKSLLTSTALVPAMAALTVASLVAWPSEAQAQDRVIDGGDSETIDGNNVDVPGVLTVGDTGEGTLNIINSGRLSTPFGSIIGFAGGSNGVVTVTSQGSRFESREIFVGLSGTGSLTIADGGFVRSDLGSVGREPGSTGTVLVTGVNSRWENAFNLNVGLEGAGNLTIADGGFISSNNSVIGRAPGSISTGLVTGLGSQWSNSGSLVIGSNLIGDNAIGILIIANRGSVSSTRTLVGRDDRSVGSLNFGAAEGGDAVAAGSLDTPTIIFGSGTGTIVFNHTDNDFELAGDISGVGTVRQLSGKTTLTGLNTFSGLTQIRGGTLALGTDNAISGSSQLNITGGTFALSSFSGTAASVNMTGGTITGPGTLGVTGDYVQSGGTLGAGAQVDVGAAGVIRLSGGTIAGTLNSAQNEMGADIREGDRTRVIGVMELAGTLDIGTGELTINAGGRVSNGFARIGVSANTTGSVLVSGVGSRWVNSSELFVGQMGRADLTITEGGFVSNGRSFIGTFAGSNGTVTVTGAGSQWMNDGQLVVGASGAGDMVVADGGVVTSTSGGIGSFNGSAGSVTVTGAGSRWVNSALLVIGGSGTGNMMIANGGFVSNSSGFIGGAGNAGSVTVTGPDSRWVNTDSLVVGNVGSGDLIIADGGAISAARLFIGANGGGNGTLNVGAAAGGMAIAAGTLDTPTIVFGAGAGTIVFNHTDVDFALGAAISGDGTLRQLAGTTILSGDSGGFSGTTTVTGGNLQVNGTFGGSVTVTGGTLSGTGTMGDVTIGSGGTLAAGQSPGTMTLDSLALNAGSVTEFELGRAGVTGGEENDLYKVTGNLALNGGAFTVFRGAEFASGQYTLFAFGSLTGDLSNMSLNSLGGGFVGNLALDDNTVLLNAAAAADLVWWNGGNAAPTGMVEGGDGVWSLGGGNFANANGTVSGPWAGNSALAVFGGTAGEVTIAPGEMLSPSGLNFLTDGYVITGGDADSGLALNSPTGIDTAGGVGATIAAVISGSGSLTKTGSGTLTLTGENTYTGLTSVLGGRLVNAGQIAADVQVFSGGTFNNLAGAQVGGRSTINAGGTLTNGGSLAGGINNSGTLISSGNVESLLNSGGAIATLAGAAEEIENFGAVTVTGDLTVNDILDNFASGRFTINSGVRLQAFNTVTNSGTAADAFEVNGMLTLTSGLFDNFNGGQLTIGATGTLNGVGFVRNRDNATLTNAGTIANSVQNAATLISTGALQRGLSNSGVASIAGQLLGAVDNSGAITLTGTTTGIGAVTQMATGSFNLAGFDTTIGSLAGRGLVELGTGTLTIGGNGASTSFGGEISGTGSLVKVGSNTFKLTSANSYTGMTFVVAGTLMIGGDDVVAAPVSDPAAIASAVIAGSVVNNAAVINNGTILGQLFNSENAAATNRGVIASMVMNDGTLTSIGTLGGGLTNSGMSEIEGVLDGDVLNRGTVTLTGTTIGINGLSQNTAGVFDLAGFDTTISLLAGGGNILLGDGLLTTGSDLSFPGADAVGTLFSGVISGSGGLAKVSNSTLVLTGENTYTGGTTISGNGILQLGEGGTLGSIIGPVINNGFLVVDRSDAFTFDSMISGTGVFVKDGTGTTTLTGANSYIGGTLVFDGRLVGDTASLQGAIRNDAELEFALGSDGTFAGMLMGSGLNRKTGAGILTFRGDGSLLAGPFAVLGGGLRLAGRLDQSAVTLAGGTTLSGNGTIGGLMVESGALVTPGTSIGTIGVAGDVTFMGGSRYLAEVSELGSDLISATGIAQLAGALDIVNIGGARYSFNSAFALFGAEGGISGSFDSVSLTGFSQIYRPTLRSGADGLALVLAPNSLAALSGPGLTDNQAAVAARFDTAVLAGFNPEAFIGVYDLAPSMLAGALDQLSGEVHASIGRSAIRQSRLPREAVLERAAGLALAEEAGSKSWGGWGKLMRSWGDVDSDGASNSGAAAQDTDTEGFVVGFDGGTANDTRAFGAGVYGSYLETRTRVDARGSSGRIEQTGGGVYASLALGDLSLVAGGGAARFDILTDRMVTLPGLMGATSNGSIGDMAQVFGRIGYRFVLGAASIEPFAAGDHAWIALDQTVESSGAAALSVGRQEYKVAGATAGLAARVPLGKLRLEGEVAARFELGDRTPEALIALAAAPGQATRIASTSLNRTAYAARLGAVLPITRRIEVRVDYSGEFSRTDTEHAALAGLSIAF